MGTFAQSDEMDLRKIAPIMAGWLGRQRAAAALVSILALAGSACTVHQTEIPQLAGPSELALSIAISATPDSIRQDGASQSAISVLARDANARPIAGLSIRLDMEVGGTIQDYGSLTARNIVTGSDGRANSIYIAPPAPPAWAGGDGTLLNILATPVGSNFQTAVAQAAQIRLVPPGVIMPPAQTPTAQFTFAPTAPTANAPVQFDASASCAGSLDAGSCSSSAGAISNYRWDFGDGFVGAGRLVTHTFTVQQSYSVTLTVTNDRGMSASTTKVVTVGAGVAPTASFTFSPTDPAPGSTVLFNGDASKAGPGHNLVQFSWNFGDARADETPNNPNTIVSSNQFLAQHFYKYAGTYTVVLSVLDDAGQKSVATQSVTVKVPSTTAGRIGVMLTPHGRQRPN